MTPFKQVAATDKTHALTKSQRGTHAQTYTHTHRWAHWLMDGLQFDFIATGDVLNGVVAVEDLSCVAETLLVNKTQDCNV